MRSLDDFKHGVKTAVHKKDGKGHREPDDDKNYKKNNMDSLTKGFGLFDNQNCHDLFQNVKVNGKSMYQNRDVGT